VTTVLANRLGAWVSTTTVIYGFNLQTSSARNREWTEAQKHIMRDRSAEGAENAIDDPVDGLDSVAG
jgi:hypothetical protein